MLYQLTFTSTKFHLQYCKYDQSKKTETTHYSNCAQNEISNDTNGQQNCDLDLYNVVLS